MNVTKTASTTGGRTGVRFGGPSERERLPFSLLFANGRKNRRNSRAGQSMPGSDCNACSREMVSMIL